jgi:hypothetical protein
VGSISAMSRGVVAVRGYFDDKTFDQMAGELKA